MEKKNLIGKKVRGFEFSEDGGIEYHHTMDECIDKIGTIIGFDYNGNAEVEFPDVETAWYYPLDQIEQHLVDDTPSQYEVGMTVYHYSYGRGKVTDINKDKFHCVGVMFPSVGSVRFMADGRVGSSIEAQVLSITPYDLVNGGATFPTFKPALPEIEKGTLVFVKTGFKWEMRFFSHFDESANIYCFINQEKSGKAESWTEYSLTNPLIED